MTDHGPDAAHQTLEAALRKTLNSHGHGFQYALAHHIRSLRSAGAHPWELEAVEFPVSLRGAATHIDLILHLSDRAARIVGECKRANPSLSNWCFVKAGGFGEDVQLELAFRSSHVNGGVGIRVSEQVVQGPRLYNLAFAIRSRGPGEPDDGRGRGVIDDAVAQVMRGANGLIELFPYHPHFLPPEHTKEGCLIVPVVFTTAHLWASDVALSQSDIATGNVIDGDLRRVPWVWLKQNFSPAMLHSRVVVRTRSPETLGHQASDIHARCVAIVGTAPEQQGLERFLRGDWLV